MIDFKAWVIHALGGVTAEEWERGLRLPRPIKAMLADINIHIARDRLESMFRLGHYHQADREARASVWIDLTRQAPFPQEEPPTLDALQASNDAWVQRNQAYGALLDTSHETPIVQRLSAIKQVERRQG